MTTVPATATDGWAEINQSTDPIFPVTVKTLGIRLGGGGGEGGSIAAIEIDGKRLVDTGIAGANEVKVVSKKDDAAPYQITVDGGEWEGSDGSASSDVDKGWNQDEVWSGFETNPDWTKVFDGSDATYVANIGNPITYSYPNNLTGTVEVTIGDFGNLQDGGEDYSLNGAPAANIAPSEKNVWKKLGTLNNQPMTITITGKGENSALISGIRVGGKRLVDTNIAGAPAPEVGDTTVTVNDPGLPGQKTVSKDVAYDAFLTCSNPTELVNMVGPITMTDENGDVKTPQTSEIVSVSNPTYTFSSAGFTVGQGGRNAGKIVSSNGGEFGEVRQSEPSDLTSNGCFFGSSPTIIDPFQIHIKSHESGPVEVYINGQATGTTASNSRFTVDLSNFTLPLTLNKINFVRPSGAGNNGPSVEIYGFYIGDQLLYDGVTYSGDTVLTFADDTDLEYFQAGDVVQEEQNSRIYSDDFITNQPTAGDKSDVFNGDPGIGKQYSGYGCVTTNEKAVVFDPPIPFEGGTIEVAAYRTASGGPFIVWISGTKYTIDILNTNTLQWNSRTDLPAGDIESFGMNTNANAWGQVRLNGVDLIDGDGTSSPAVKVVSVDAANSQMVVDGGEWSSLDPADSADFTPDTNNSMNGTNNAAKAFDGSLSTFANPTVGTNPLGAFATYAPTPAISNVTKLRVYTNFATHFTLNGGERTAFSEGSSVGWKEIYDGSAITLTSLQIERALPGGQTDYGYYIYAFEVNGVTLTETLSGDRDVSLPTLEASATDVVGVTGNTLQIDGVSGTWKTGLHIKGAEITPSAPSPTGVVFTSMNGGSTDVTGTDASLSSRVWTLEKSNSQGGPWTVVGEYVDTSANDSQNGATPWASKPQLEPNTFYQVKVKYTSDNASSKESTFNTFKTGDA
jgi:hypothetical protein